MMAARLRNAGRRVDNSVSVEDGLDARLSGSWGRCDAEKKRNPDDRNNNRDNKGRFHSLTPVQLANMPSVMMTVVSRECKGETGRLARLIAISGDWQR
jgi:hypothetical protein